MTELALFAATTFALLAVPGPTNTLLAASGAAAGFYPSLPLVLAEFSGYGTSISVLMAASTPLTAAFPVLPMVFRVALILYLLWLSWRLWLVKPESPRSSRPVTFGHVFVTTLLNPKAAIFAFAVFPDPTTGPERLLPAAAIFAALVLCMGATWTFLGASLGRLTTSVAHVRRASASVLLVFACLIATATFTST